MPAQMPAKKTFYACPIFLPYYKKERKIIYKVYCIGNVFAGD